MTWLLVVMAFYVPFRVCMYWNESTSESNGVFVFELCTDVAFGIGKSHVCKNVYVNDGMDLVQ